MGNAPSRVDPSAGPRHQSASPSHPTAAEAAAAAAAAASASEAAGHRELERRLRYEALGESEAAAARQDPFPPNAFPASRPPPTGKREKTTHASSSSSIGGGAEAAAAAAASSSSAAASALPARSDFRARISESVPSQLAAINQNVLKENPTVTEELHKQGQHSTRQRGLLSCGRASSSSVSLSVSCAVVHFGHEMLAGSVASVISRFCVAPLDVLKIRFQIQEQAAHQRQYTSVLQAFKAIYNKEGILVRQTAQRRRARRRRDCDLILVLCAALCFRLRCRRSGKATLPLS